MSDVLRGGARRSLRRAAAAALIAAPLVLTGTAAAADAPLRSIGIGPDDKRTWQIAWFSSNESATQVVGTIRPHDNYTEGREEGVVARDVVAGKTTLLVPAPSTLIGASADVQRLLFLTPTSYSSSDTNDQLDAYVLDRATGVKTLLTADESGKAIGDNEYPDDLASRRWLRSLAISPDGGLAQFSVKTFAVEDAPAKSYRVDLDSGQRTELPSTLNGYTRLVDDAGRVLLGGDGITVDGKEIAKLSNTWDDFTLSPNGRYLGFSRYQPENFVVYDLQTGEKVDIPWPSYPNQRTPKVRRVADDGKSVIISDWVGQMKDARILYGRLATDGTLTQLGGGVRLSTWGRNDGDEQFWEQGNITQDGQFAITGLSIAQLGSAPLPGTEPTAPRAENIGDYVSVQDASCTTNSFINLPWLGRWRDPSIYVADTAQRADVRYVVGFKGKASWLLWGQPYPNLTVQPGPTVPLPKLGRFGGWRIDGTITFDDGSTLSGSKVVGYHGLAACRFSLFG